jgi:hypothetical protein
MGAKPKRDLGLHRPIGKGGRQNIGRALARWPPVDRETPVELTPDWLNQRCLPRLNPAPEPALAPTPGLCIGVELGGEGHRERPPLGSANAAVEQRARAVIDAEFCRAFHPAGREHDAAAFFRSCLPE